MKKILLFCLVSVFACALLTSGCASPSDGASPPASAEPSPVQSPPEEPTPTEEPSPNDPAGADGDTAAILQSVLDNANEVIQADGGFGLPMTFNDPVSDENCGGLGLTAEVFNDNVVTANKAAAMVMGNPFEMALFQCKDAAAAATVKKAVADNYDTGKQICAFPEQCFVIDAGGYVLLAAVRNEEAEAVQNAFNDAVGETGTVNVFYTRAVD